MAITEQEAWTQREGKSVRVPDFISEVVERVAFEARTDKRIDRRSGVSQRLPITLLENVVSNAERRALTTGEKEVVPRFSDLYAALPAITGKIELEYEGELVGAHAIAAELIRRAADATFRDRAEGANTDDIVMWFDAGSALSVGDDATAEAALAGLTVVPGLLPLVERVGLAMAKDPLAAVGACELVLESLVARRRISRNEAGSYGRAEKEKRRRPNDELFGGLNG